MKTRVNTKKLTCILPLMLVVLIVASLLLGAVDLRLLDSAKLYKVVLLLRLPRTIAGILVGASLSSAGYMLQALFHNPLGSPNILGVNSSAAFSVTLASLAFPRMVGLLPLAAFIGALVALILVCLIARLIKDNERTLILSGIAVGALFQGAIDFLSVLSYDSIYISPSLRLGSLGSTDINLIYIGAPIVLASLTIVLLISRNIQVYTLGPTVAASLGLNVARTRFTILLLCAILSGISVSLVGIVGFVGLITPHIIRSLFKGEIRRQLSLTMLGGAILVLLSDLVARIAFAPHEVPVGVILQAIGVPFFLYIAVRSSRRS